MSLRDILKALESDGKMLPISGPNLEIFAKAITAIQRIIRLKNRPLLRMILLAAFRRRMPKLAARAISKVKAERKEAENIIRKEMLK